jgi:DNA ligase 1
LKSISEIINELNIENGSNYKLSVLKKYTDHKQLQRVLQMTHDRVKYTYGLSAKRWLTNPEIYKDPPVQHTTLDDALDFMEDALSTRKVTGNQAHDMMESILLSLSAADTDVILKVLNRDLRTNMGRTQINKVFPDLIMKPVYMRCGIFGPKTAKDIKFPAYIQLKADGTYREACVSNGKVEFVSRSGESYVYPVLESHLAQSPDGYYVGELLVRGSPNRAESNGLINSDNPPHDIIDFFVWDYVTPEEYANAHNKVANKIPYEDRLRLLELFVAQMDTPNIQVIENHEVKSIDEALQLTSKWMDQDLEGGVLKNKKGVFKNGTSKDQLKLKLEIDLEVRITGFQEGTPGTVREKTFGAILFETDDGKIKGRTSGFSDVQLEDFNSRRAEMIGKVITVRCNDITRGRANEHYALSHPRFIEVREDKTETDTLERALETKDMAKGLK